MRVVARVLALVEEIAGDIVPERLARSVSARRAEAEPRGPGAQGLPGRPRIGAPEAKLTTLNQAK